MDFSGEKRSNATHQSTTDGEARLFKKGEFTEAKLRFMTHALAENRNGLVVDVETTQASGTAEWEAAKRMIGRTVQSGATVGADKGYDTADFVSHLQGSGHQGPRGQEDERQRGRWPHGLRGKGYA